METKRKCFKVFYATKKIAKNEKKRLNLMKKFNGRLTDVYYCTECLGYHLTSTPKKRSRSYKRILNKK